MEQYDARIERGRERRDAADREWLQQHKAEVEREDRIRGGRVTGKVVKGMSPADVRAILGEPQESSRSDDAAGDKEKWTYRTASGTQVVTFRNGEVSGVRASRSRKGSR